MRRQIIQYAFRNQRIGWHYLLTYGLNVTENNSIEACLISITKIPLYIYHTWFLSICFGRSFKSAGFAGIKGCYLIKSHHNRCHIKLLDCSLINSKPIRAPDKVRIFYILQGHFFTKSYVWPLVRIVSSRRFYQVVKHTIWWRNTTSRVDWSSLYAPYLEPCKSKKCSWICFCAPSLTCLQSSVPFPRSI